MFEVFRRKKDNAVVVKELRETVKELQNSVSVLLGDNISVSRTDRGNPYRTYKEAVAELAMKYEGTADWGCIQARNIIDVRSAFIIGQGFKVVGKDKAAESSREMEFIQEFIKANNLDEEMPQDLAKEAEIEGRMLLKLVPDMEKKTISIRYVSFSTYGYTVETDPNDYQKITKATYRTTTGNVELKPEEFVYKKFAGRVDKVNDVMPKVAMVLRPIEDLDKALVDWRLINHLFAAPTPHFKVATKEEIEPLQKKLLGINWKIGKMLVTNAEFSLVTYTGDAKLENEIITNVKIISGASGVPVHFLGMPDLMSNRAVSTDLFEFINASTNKERKIWEGLYEELFDKVLTMANTLWNKGYETGKIKATLLNLTEAKIKELTDVWLPLYVEGVIDLDYFLSKIPDIDPEKVKKAQDEKQTELLKKVKDLESQAGEEDEPMPTGGEAQ